MGTGLIAGAVAGGVVLAGAAASLGGALKLFNSVIPRQKELRVNMNEMADAQKWEEYKKLIYPAKEWLMAQPLEPVSIQARDGITLRGHYLPAKEKSNRLVIALHGYTSSGLSNFCGMSQFYQNMGFSCLIVDHRAHGESDGDYVGFGILDRYDCLAWINYALERFGPDTEILLQGISMGASTALMTLGFDELPKAVKGVVSDCAFTSPYDVFAHVIKRDYKMQPFPMMNISDSFCQKKAGYRFKDYSTLTALAKTDRPVLLIHGKEDNFVPTWMSEKNFEVCKSPKKLLMIDNAGHGASYYENHEVYEQAVSEFVEKYMPAK
ncbi:MAG: alpha/beta hydrolase [Ruminococcus sp.]|nr:alpha/beta hydrolase [Ruminococcus sp.]